MTLQRKVGVDLLGARLEALGHVGDVDGKRNLPTPRRPRSPRPSRHFCYCSISVPDGPR